MASKRLLYLDVMRGFFIVYVIFIHALVFRVFKGDLGYVDKIPTHVLIMLVPFILIGTWGALFTFVSVTANSYVMRRTVEKGGRLGKAAGERVLSGVFVVLFHYFNMFLFAHFGPQGDRVHRSLITGFLETGEWRLPSAHALYYSGTLLLIGLMGIISAALLYLLWRKDGFHKDRRNLLVLTAIAVILLFSFPFLYQRYEPLIPVMVAHGNYPGAVLLAWLLRPQFSIFPMGAFGIFGVMFGILLAKGTSRDKIRKFGYGSGLSLILIDLVLLAVLGPPDLTKLVWPITLYLFNLGALILLATFLMMRLDFSSDEERKRRARRTLWIRRFSMVALTVFVLESTIAVLWSHLFEYLWPGLFPFNAAGVIAYLAAVLLTWFLIVWMWEKYGFKYSFEWFLVRIIGRLRGRRSGRMNIDEVIYGPMK